MDRPIPSEEVPEYYLRLSDSLSSLDLDGVEIILKPWRLFRGILEVNVIKIFLLMPKNVGNGVRLKLKNVF